MYIVGMNFHQVLEFVPKKGVIAELGVKRGANARRMFKTTDAAMMHLVDPWAKDEDVGYASLHSAEERQDFVGYYNEMVSWSESPEAGGRVNVIRDYAADAASSFEDKYFDFVYVDTLDSYDGFYGDLAAYAPKMKDEAILSGDDYYDMQYATHKMRLRDRLPPTQSLCMIHAANDFCEMHGWEILFITDEYLPARRPPRFFAGKVGVFGDAHRLLDQVLRVTPWAVEVANPRDVRQTMVTPLGSTNPEERRFFTKII